MPALVQMQRKYTLNVNGVRFADAFYIAYARRKLLLRLGAGHQSQIPLLVEHAKLGTVFRYRLDREGNEPWVSRGRRCRAV